MDKLKIRNIDHLGIIAGIIDQIGLVEIVNQEIGENSQEKISAGIVVKAMILNGLGFVSAPLYLFSKFFEGKAIEHLLGEGIKAKDLNDDKLGRILDKLYKAGLTQLFIKIALAAVKIFSVEMKNLHLDSSSLSVEGEYLEKGGIEEGILKITYGYSRDKRPDLKQFMIDLICSGDGDIPLYFRVGDGNESDQKIFAQIIKEYKKGWQIEALFVADAALYSEENIQILGETSWLSRVSSTLNEALSLKQELNEAAFKDSEREGYRLAELCSWYAGIPQRWLVVESSERKKADLKKLDKKIEKAFQNAEKELEKFKKIDFASERETERVQKLRVEYRETVRDIPAEEMIFVDEAGSNLGMTLLYARSEKGTRAYGEVPCHRGENVSMISAISLKGVLTLIQLLGATQGIQFEAFIANVLLPLIWPGAYVIMDNARIHQEKYIRPLIESVGAHLIFLPPYSPDFSPIENCWSKIKQILRSLEPRNYLELKQAVQEALERITLQDIHNWFTHCCYCDSDFVSPSNSC